MMMWTTSTVCSVEQKNSYLQITRNTRTRCVEQSFHKPEKTADTQRYHWCFSGKMMSKLKTVNCFVTHEALKSSYELVETCLCVPDLIGIWKCWFLRRGENRSTRRKTSRSKGENEQQIQLTYGVKARIQTWATLV